MLSFNKGRDIAIIIGGKYNGKVLKLDTDVYDDDEYDINGDSLCYIDESFYKKNMNKPKLIQIEQLKKAIKKKNKPLDEEMLNAYNKAMNIINNKQNKELIIHEGKLEPIPNTEKIERLYIAGPSDSGKSTYAAMYISNFLCLNPNKKFYIFSRVEKDDVLDELDPIRIVINDELLSNPISPEEMKDSIVLFDDIDTIQSKKIADVVRRLRDDLLETGRHEKAYVVAVSHQLLNYKHTRQLLNEATSVTFFPCSGSDYHIKRFLKTYCGLDEGNIKKILKLPSRWVTLYKTFPMYVIYEKGCFLISK